VDRIGPRLLVDHGQVNSGKLAGVGSHGHCGAQGLAAGMGQAREGDGGSHRGYHNVVEHRRWAADGKPKR
jgi:hypothetical protein